MNGTLTPGRVEAAIWLTAIAGCVLWLGLRTDWARELRQPAPAFAPRLSSAEAPQLLPMPAPLAPEDAAEITARPLFVITRRPVPAAPPPPAPEPPRPQMEKGQFALAGTSIVEGKAIAFLTEVRGGKYRVVPLGGTINGIRVADIQADRVVLAQFDDTETLTLPVRTVRASPAAPGAPGAPPPAGSPPPGASGAAGPQPASGAGAVPMPGAPPGAAAAPGGEPRPAAGPADGSPPPGQAEGQPRMPFLERLRQRQLQQQQLQQQQQQPGAAPR